MESFPYLKALNFTGFNQLRHPADYLNLQFYNPSVQEATLELYFTQGSSAILAHWISKLPSLRILHLELDELPETVLLCLFHAIESLEIHCQFKHLEGEVNGGHWVLPRLTHLFLSGTTRVMFSIISNMDAPSLLYVQLLELREDNLNDGLCCLISSFIPTIRVLHINTPLFTLGQSAVHYAALRHLEVHVAAFERVAKLLVSPSLRFISLWDYPRESRPDGRSERMERSFRDESFYLASPLQNPKSAFPGIPWHLIEGLRCHAEITPCCTITYIQQLSALAYLTLSQATSLDIDKLSLQILQNSTFCPQLRVIETPLFPARWAQLCQAIWSRNSRAILDPTVVSVFLIRFPFEPHPVFLLPLRDALAGKIFVPEPVGPDPESATGVKAYKLSKNSCSPCWRSGWGSDCGSMWCRRKERWSGFEVCAA